MSWVARSVGSVLLGVMIAACGKSPPESDRVGVIAAPLGGGASGCDEVVAIHDCSELQAIAGDLEGCYELANDVDCTGFDAGDGRGFRPIGDGGFALDPFRGSFDGRGHVIKGLSIQRPWSNWVGLFGLTWHADIRGVGLVDVDVRGFSQVGALAGTAMHGTIAECYATGTVQGGLVVGGLVGTLKSGALVVDSYTATDSAALLSQGLIAGAVLYSAEVQRSYASGNMTPGGRLAGAVSLGGDVDDSFFDCDVAGHCSASGARHTPDMQSDAQYLAAGWDLESVWGFSASGTYPCLRWQPECGPPCGPTDETCDGVDDDCNGTADEDYVAQATSCGTGACTSTGSISCVAGAVQDSCTPGTPAADDATCDGIDDDCNGTADEDYVAQATSCGIGPCASTGSTSCVAGTVQDSCAPGTPAADDATCNGIDDDCSGTADEDYVALVTTCGVGECASTGNTSCVAGTVQDSCTPGLPAAGDPSCNDRDEDCDGAADEDFLPFCTGDALTECDMGTLVPAPCTDGDVCNGAETCADAACQPGTPLELDDGNECTADACDPESGPTHTPVPDGTLCDGDSMCRSGECVIPRSCLEWHRADPDAPDGVYLIDVDGDGPTDAFEVYCDMTTAGGGWQLITVSDPSRVLVGTGFCLTPDAATACAGQLHPLQPSSRSTILIRDLVTGSWLEYGGFSGGASSALRYFTRELALTSGFECLGSHVCGNVTRDPGLTVKATSGFVVDHVLPLRQWWRSGGWWVGGDPGAELEAGRVHASTYGAPMVTDIRARTSRSASSVAVGTGTQAIFHRDDGCANGVQDAYETGVDCGGTCGGCHVGGECSAHRDCATGYCDGGLCAAPAASCAEILSANTLAESGKYLIDVDGAGTTDPFEVYCDMTTDGGGWQLVSSVRSDMAQTIFGDTYCTDPSPALNCHGRANPLQVSASTEVMVRTPGSGDHVVYAGFAGDAGSSLRYFTRELNLGSGFSCTAPHVCADSTRDPALHVARTSGYMVATNVPLLQWWRLGGWWVGADPNAALPEGNLHSSGYNATTALRSRPAPDADSLMQSPGNQVLQVRNQAPVPNQCMWLGQPAVAGTPCDDGDLCDGDDVCDGAGSCLPGTAPPSCSP